MEKGTKTKFVKEGRSNYKDISLCGTTKTNLLLRTGIFYHLFIIYRPQTNKQTNLVILETLLVLMLHLSEAYTHAKQ